MRDFCIVAAVLFLIFFIGEKTIWKCAEGFYSDFTEYKAAGCVTEGDLFAESRFNQIQNGQIL